MKKISMITAFTLITVGLVAYGNMRMETAVTPGSAVKEEEAETSMGEKTEDSQHISGEMSLESILSHAENFAEDFGLVRNNSFSLGEDFSFAELGKNVQEIGEKAMEGFGDLKDISISGTLEKIAEEALSLIEVSE